MSAETEIYETLCYDALYLYVCLYVPKKKNANLISKPNQASGYSTEWYLF